MTAFERAARALIASRASAGTRKLYTGDLDLWLFFCRHTQVDPADPPLEAAVAHRDALQARYEPLTVRRILAALSRIYRAAQAARAAAWNPFSGDALPRPPATYVRTEAVPEAVAHRIISTTQEDESLTGFRDLAVLRLLHATGMRRASVAGLRREHVFERGGRLIAGFYGKGNKWHEATLPEEAADAVRTWLRISVLSTTYVFPQNGGFKPMDPSTVNRIITKRMRGAGVTGVHPHQFRAAFITEALDELPLHEVQAAVGHADPRQTLQYDRRQRGQGVADHVAAKRKR